MSTDSEIYPKREKVLVVQEGQLVNLPYPSLNVGTYYCIQLISGSYSIYKKTNLFDDELSEKVKTQQAAIELLIKLNQLSL